MEINDDALEFCENLLSYAYNSYFRGQKDFEFQSTLPDRIGELVLHSYSVHNATFKRLLMRNFHRTCKDEVQLLCCVVGHSSKIVDDPCQTFLSSAALLIHHMYLGFDRKCYRFLQTSSICLYIMLNRLVASNEYRGFSHFFGDLMDHCRRYHFSTMRSRSLVEASVEADAPEPVRMLQRALIGRMYSRQVRVDMDHQMNRPVPRCGFLRHPEIELVMDGDFSFNFEDDGEEDACTLCGTICSINYEMYVLDHRGEPTV